MRPLRTRLGKRRAAVLASSLLLAACGDDEALSPRCLPVDPAVLTAVEAGVAAQDGAPRLRHGYAVRSDDREVYFLSAELVVGGRNERRGDILTWATADPRTPSDDYRAVDTKAKELSGWAPSGDAVRITTDGAVLSRACVNTKRPV